MGSTELVAGFECSGNRRPLQGCRGNGRWTGVPLRAVLDRAGLKPQAREFVFFGADRGEEEVEFRTQKFSVEQQYGRSMTREQALSSDAFLAWALNGEPLTRHQGSPLRLLVPGWYGMANVKWLAQVHAQEDAYLGKFQARQYRTLRGETIDGEVKWTEAGITTMQPKSFLARVTRGRQPAQRARRGAARRHAAEIRRGEGRRRSVAARDASIRRRARNTRGSCSPTRGTTPRPASTRSCRASPTRTAECSRRTEELESKKTFLEDNSQYPRKIVVG